MELNIVTPSSQVAFLGNKVPLSRQEMLSRPLLNTGTAQTQSQLYGQYLGLLQKYMPNYAVNAWANPAYGLNNQYFALPRNASSIQPYAQPYGYPQAYGMPYGGQNYYRPTFVTPSFRF